MKPGPFAGVFHPCPDSERSKWSLRGHTDNQHFKSGRPPTHRSDDTRSLNTDSFAPALVLALGFAGTAQADCIDTAAERYGVNAHVLRAIGWHESRLRSSAIARNSNGTVDIGAFQINSTHLGTLSAHGVDANALKDGCVSAHVGAWHYRRQVQAFGNTWRAVGAYHSRTPARSAWYANAIAAVLMKWGVAPAGPLPYASAATLAPGQSGPSLSRSVATARQPSSPGDAPTPAAVVYQPDAPNDLLESSPDSTRAQPLQGLAPPNTTALR